MSVTRTQIRQEVGRILAGPQILVSIASTNSNVNTVILDDYLSTLLQSPLFVGKVLYVSYDAGGTHGAPEGEWARIASYAPTTGIFTLDNVTSAAVTASDQVEIWLTLHPNLVHEAIDRALRKMLYRSPALPSLLADGDMETSGYADWTAGTSATVAKTTTAGTYFRGTQALSVTADATGNRYAYQRVNVMPGEQYYIWGAVRSSVATTEAKLVLYDNTNGAQIDSDTSTQLAWQGLSMSFTIPSGCKQLEVRLQTVTASGVTYWDQLQLLNKKTIRYVLPTWVTEEWQVGRLVYQYEGAATVGDAWAVDEVVPRRWELVRVYKEGSRVYITPNPPFNNEAPIYIECLRHYSALSTDASTTDADLDWIAAKGRYECLRILSAPAIPAEEREEFKKALEEAKMEAAAMDARFMPKVDYPWTPFGEELWAPQEVGR